MNLATRIATAPRRKYHIYRERNFPPVVFIHINKTAGSSIEKALGIRFEHKTAQEKRAELGDKAWSRAFKFSFVRNPWDKVCSHYHYRVKTDQTGLGDSHLGFTDWVRLAYGDRDPRYYDQPKMFQPQADWLCDAKGRLLVDFVGRFERLAEEMTTLESIVGRPMQLPHLKPSDRGSYRDYYDETARQVVEQRFERDLELFGYSF